MPKRGFARSWIVDDLMRERHGVRRGCSLLIRSTRGLVEARSCGHRISDSALGQRPPCSGSKLWRIRPCNVRAAVQPVLGAVVALSDGNTARLRGASLDRGRPPSQPRVHPLSPECTLVPWVHPRCPECTIAALSAPTPPECTLHRDCSGLVTTCAALCFARELSSRTGAYLWGLASRVRPRCSSRGPISGGRP